MKDEIIKILGDNHTDPINFGRILDLSNVYGLYTYNNNVFVFKDGMDCGFDSFNKAERIEIRDAVISRKWFVDPSL